MEDSMALGYALGNDASNNNSGSGWGNESWIWILVIFALLGWGNNGNGNNGGGGMASYIPFMANQGALTRADLCDEFNANNMNNAVRGVQQGICDSAYAINTSLMSGFAGVGNAVCNSEYQNAQLINGVNTNLMQGFNSANVVALQNQNALATQLAECCCKNSTGQMQIQNAIESSNCSLGRSIERGFADTNYNMATNNCALQTSIANSTRDMIDNQNANTREIMNFMVNSKMEALQNENQSLKLAASQAAQNNYLISELRPIAQPAYITCNPYTGLYGGYSYGNCGCNTNCCGCNG